MLLKITSRPRVTITMVRMGWPSTGRITMRSTSSPPTKATATVAQNVTQ